VALEGQSNLYIYQVVYLQEDNGSSDNIIKRHTTASVSVGKKSAPPRQNPGYAYAEK